MRRRPAAPPAAPPGAAEPAPGPRQRAWWPRLRAWWPQVRAWWAQVAHSAWPARATWLALPLVAGPALADALDGWTGGDRPVQIVASAGAWAVWAGALVATLVPSTVSLTVVRTAAPAAVAASLAALAAAGPSPASVAGLAAALVAALAALAPETAEAFVTGSSYGDERRLPLRAPTLLLAGPAELAWLATVAGLAAGPLALAARQWVVGALALAAGLPAARWGARVLHSLARRWLVFVPNGVVVHDQLTLADPVLLPRSRLRSIGPAPAGTTALDLTAGASGLALEVRLSEPVTLVPTAPRRRSAGLARADALLVTPSRPGRALAEARRRRLA